MVFYSYPTNSQVDAYNSLILNLLPVNIKLLYTADFLEGHADVFNDSESNAPPISEAILDYVSNIESNGIPATQCLSNLVVFISSSNTFQLTVF